MSVKLVQHQLKYAKTMHALSSMPEIRVALGLPINKLEDIENFIKKEILDEKAGRTLPRAILNEADEFIGVTALTFIDLEKKSCHIGSWLGRDYWGKGYNFEAKIAILELAFFKLGLERVFAGARKVNIRSQKAQEKLPFIRLGVENEYPEEHHWLEAKEKQSCVLNVFVREDFVRWKTTLEEVKDSRNAYLPYLLLADESEEIVRTYMDEGDLYAIHFGEEIAGVALLVAHSPTIMELKNIAVSPYYQGQGIGKYVISNISAIYREKGYKHLLVGTANSSITNIAFYQKAGFRLTSIQKGFFTKYPEPIYENGIRAMDMLMFEKEL